MNNKNSTLLTAALCASLLAPNFSVAATSPKATKAANFAQDSKLTLVTYAKFTSDPSVSPLDINVETINGVVHLVGLLETNDQRDAAVKLAKSSKGVKDVNYDNLLVVESEQPMTDTWITTKVKAVLLKEQLVNKKNVSGLKVETKNGVVYLSGKAPKADSDYATKVVSGISGLGDSKVVNQIKS
ncbi:MAG: BON domain-containing protein [Gammaproteobacteria bacterium]